MANAAARSKLEDFLELAGSLAERLVYVCIDEGHRTAGEGIMGHLKKAVDCVVKARHCKKGIWEILNFRSNSVSDRTGSHAAVHIGLKFDWFFFAVQLSFFVLILSQNFRRDRPLFRSICPPSWLGKRSFAYCLA
jgi:hypothetical protein